MIGICISIYEIPRLFVNKFSKFPSIGKGVPVMYGVRNLESWRLARIFEWIHETI